MIALSDDCPPNDVVSADQFPNFSLSFRGQCRRQDPLVSASNLDASASVVPPPEPHTYEEITLPQLIDEVRALYVQQTSFQQYIVEEHQRLSQQYRQLLHRQRFIFKHFGIPYPFPPPSPPSSQPQ